MDSEKQLGVIILTRSIVTSLVLVLIGLSVLILSETFLNKRVYAQTAPSSAFSPQIRKTGVDSSNNKRGTLGSVDNYWTINRVYNDTAPPWNPSCQGTGARNAILVNEYSSTTATDSGARAGRFPVSTAAAPWRPPFVYPNDYPYDASTAARWIGQDQYAAHYGSGWQNPGMTTCRDYSSPPDGGGNGTCDGICYTANQGHTWVFRFTQPIDIDPSVLLSSVRINLSGRVDNFVGVTVNGTPLNVSCSGSGSLPSTDSRLRNPQGIGDNGRPGGPGQGVSNYINMCATGFGTGSASFNATQAGAGTAFRANDNVIEIHVKSAYGNVGLLLDNAIITGDLIPPPNVPYIVCDPDMINSVRLTFNGRDLADGEDLPPGATLTAGVNVRNNSTVTGTSPSATAVIRNSSWQTVSTISPVSAPTSIPAGATRSFSTGAFQVPTVERNGYYVLFFVRVANQPGSRSCYKYFNVVAPPTPPSVTITGPDAGANPSCTQLNYNVTNPSAASNSMRVVLVVDGVEQTGAYSKSNQSQGNSSFYITPWIDIVAHSFEVRMYDSAGVMTPSGAKNSPSNCVQITGCSGFSPVSVASGEVFSMSFGATLNTTLGSNISRNYTIGASSSFYNGPMYVGTSGTNVNGTLTSASSTISGFRPNLSIPSGGSYDVTITINGLNPSPFSCPVSSIIASDQPYFRLYGNDTIVCGGPVQGSAGYSGAPGPATYRGAAAQLAIFAANQITGVMSGSQYPGRITPWDIAFANAVAGTTSYPYDFGGGIASCPQSLDYAVTTNGTVSNITGTTTSGVYRWSGSDIKGSIADGQQVVIYVANADGTPRDIVISKNGGGPVGPGITYANTSWLNASQIPSFTLIATGNIYVQNNVNQLDGHYIAGGDIFTCSPSTGSLGNDLTGAEAETGASRPMSEYIIDNCDNQLVVYGSFKANKVHFLRSGGTVNGYTPAPATP